MWVRGVTRSKAMFTGRRRSCFAAPCISVGRLHKGQASKPAPFFIQDSGGEGCCFGILCIIPVYHLFHHHTNRHRDACKCSCNQRTWHVHILFPYVLQPCNNSRFRKYALFCKLSGLATYAVSYLYPFSDIPQDYIRLTCSRAL